MIDTSNAKWALSKEEKYAIKWLENKGFEGTLEKQYISKTVFTVTRDGSTARFELLQGFTGIKMGRYMEQYERSFNMARELERLREKLKDVEE